MLRRKNKFHKYKYQKKQISSLKYKYVLQKTNYINANLKKKYKYDNNKFEFENTNIILKRQIAETQISKSQIRNAKSKC